MSPSVELLRTKCSNIPNGRTKRLLFGDNHSYRCTTGWYRWLERIAIHMFSTLGKITLMGPLPHFFPFHLSEDFGCMRETHLPEEKLLSKSLHKWKKQQPGITLMVRAPGGPRAHINFSVHMCVLGPMGNNENWDRSNKGPEKSWPRSSRARYCKYVLGEKGWIHRAKSYVGFPSRGLAI